MSTIKTSILNAISVISCFNKESPKESKQPEEKTMGYQHTTSGITRHPSPFVLNLPKEKPCYDTPKPTVIRDKFDSKEANEQLDIATAMGVHFQGIGTNGGRIYKLSRKCARWLLRSCYHTLPEGDKVDDVFDFRNRLDCEEVSGVWPEEPLIINTTTNTIEGGVVRLFALAISQATNMNMNVVLTSEGNYNA